MLDIVYSRDYLAYNFGAQHPFSPDRWEALEELLRLQGPAANWIEPEPVHDADLLRIHTVPFVEAVHAASAGFPGTHSSGFGLNTQDVPIFYGMHEASALICGGSVEAARRMATGDAGKVLQLGGGLHHAMPNRASGFCVYNDVALAILTLRDHGLRVAYVDIDVHHGDGVQKVFYEDPDVLTISIHEDGRFLFPGTGFISERGSGQGMGASVNIPVYPDTGDAEWLNAFDRIVPRVLDTWKPDVIVVEAGADAHFGDPLASLKISTHGFSGAIDRLISLSNHYAGGRLLATLGGGYNFESTLRQWFILGCLMAGMHVPDSLNDDWCTRWESRRSISIPRATHDPVAQEADSDRMNAAGVQNAKMLDELERILGA